MFVLWSTHTQSKKTSDIFYSALLYIVQITSIVIYLYNINKYLLNLPVRILVLDSSLTSQFESATKYSPDCLTNAGSPSIFAVTELGSVEIFHENESMWIFLLPSGAGFVKIKVSMLLHFFAAISSVEQQKWVESIFSKFVLWITDNCTPVDTYGKSLSRHTYFVKNVKTNL